MGIFNFYSIKTIQYTLNTLHTVYTCTHYIHSTVHTVYTHTYSTHAIQLIPLEAFQSRLVTELSTVYCLQCIIWCGERLSI